MNILRKTLLDPYWVASKTRTLKRRRCYSVLYTDCSGSPVRWAFDISARDSFEASDIASEAMRLHDNIQSLYEDENIVGYCSVLVEQESPTIIEDIYKDNKGRRGCLGINFKNSL